MTQPYITTLIDTYNHECFIEQAIVSVLEQDFPSSEHEIIVVDDGSLDATRDLIRKFEPKVRLLCKPNGGQASAFNEGIPECRGEIVAFLDGDDWWAQNKLMRVAAAFEKYPDVGGVGHGYFQVDTPGRIQATVVPDETKRLSMHSVESAREFGHLKGFFGTSKVAYRKWVLDRILPIPAGAIIEADEFIFTLAVCIADLVALDEPLFFYRFHEGNLFMIQADDTVRSHRKYDSLVCLLKYLPERIANCGVPAHIGTVLLSQLALDVERCRLQIEGGTRLEVLRAERAVYDLSYRNRPLGYRIFKYLVLGLSVLLSPNQFFKMKAWYTSSGLRDLRRFIGEPTPVAAVIKRINSQ
jgi:glycosyltransferase involved in cell wall biosynthesis